MNLVAARERWREQRARLGGSNPLEKFEPSSFGQIDLLRAHPGGLAQLASAGATSISNLVRDDLAQARALSAARRISERARHIRTNFGIQTSYIAAGLVRFPRYDASAPLLLRPVAVTEHGDDFTLHQSGTPILNPVAIELLQLGSPQFKTQPLTDLVRSSTDLLPYGLLEALAAQVDSSYARPEELLVLANFAPELIFLRASPLAEDNDLIRQLYSEEFESPEPAYSAGALTLSQNADATQQRVIRRALSGQSFVVETLPGCGYLQTVVNLMGQLALEEKRMLVVAPRQQTLDELSERLTAANLPALGLRLENLWFDALSAIARNKKELPVAMSDAREALARKESAVVAYFEAVERQSEALGVSPMDAMKELARLSVLPSAPTNSARILSDDLPRMRTSGLELLQRAREAGLFDFGPDDSAWFRARFSNADEIAVAVRRAKALSEGKLSEVRYQIDSFIADQLLSPASCAAEWSVRLELLLGVRETLDKFRPEIYDRSLSEMIAATAPRRDRNEMSGSQRRRYKKLAKEFIRPGMSVGNLHEALAAAEKQRRLWRELCLSEAPPKTPIGLTEMNQAAVELLGELDGLQRHLNPDPALPPLERLPFDELLSNLASLAGDTAILERLLEREEIWLEIGQFGLSELAEQLSKIHPDSSQLELEFEQCWWQSIFERVIASDSSILDYSAERIAKLEGEYEQAADLVLSQGPAEIRDMLSNNWNDAHARYPAHADELRNLLRAGRETDELAEMYRSGGQDNRAKQLLEPAKAFQVAQPLWRAITPALLLSPYRLHELHPEERFDVLLVLDAAATGMAEALSAISRAEQVIAFGDPVIAEPESFETVARPVSSEPGEPRESVFESLRPLGVETISRNYRMDGQVLGEFLNAEFFSNRIVLEPTARQYFGARNLEVVTIETGVTADSTIAGATESPDGEVARVTDLVLNHARWRPSESLLVVSASKAHAERIQAAVAAELTKQAQVAEFFDAHGRERFECTSLGALTHRIADRVIFSIGFGKTPEGKVPSSLGDLNQPGARRMIANLVVSARKQLTVVTCFNESDLSSRSSEAMLRRLITQSAESLPAATEADPLLRDLALRLEKLGLTVRLGFADRIGLVASFGNQAAVIDPDWGLLGESWDERLRLRPNLLRAMGWSYLRVHALEIFSTPQQVALRIARSLGAPDPQAPKSASDSNLDSNDARLESDKPPHWG
ncbi:MAG: hypothetical protein RL198_28 [Actinomycetota bacterium]